MFALYNFIFGLLNVQFLIKCFDRMFMQNSVRWVLCFNPLLPADANIHQTTSAQNHLNLAETKS